MITCSFEVYGTELSKAVICPICGGKDFNETLLGESKLECAYCNYILEFSDLRKLKVEKV